VTTDHTKRRRALAAAIRQLSNVFVTSDMADADLDAATKSLGDLARQFVADDVVDRRKRRGRSFFNVPRVDDDPQEQSLFEDSAFSGRSNPMATNARFWVDNDVAHMVVIFDAVTEGAHDRVHGGVVAGLFDELVGAMISSLREPAFTVQLNVRFREGTPLGVPVEGTARITGRDGRRISLTAEMHSGEHVVAEAEALFLTVNPEQFGGPGRHL